MKKIVIGLVLLVVVVAAVAVFVLTNLGAIIKSAVEKYGSEATGTSVTLSSADVSLSSGDGTLKGLVVGNPKGFASSSAFELGEISLKVDTNSVTTDTIVVREVVIQGPRVTYELGNSLSSNLEAIQKSVEAYSRMLGGGGGGGDAAKAEDGGKKMIIEHLYVRGGRVTLAATAAAAAGGKSASADIPEIHLKDIGKASGGATGAQVTAIVLEELTKSSIGAAARGQFEKAAEGLLDKAGDKLKDILGGKKR
jgi:uncharacterized protein involved in outer membrane biogenesis